MMIFVARLGKAHARLLVLESLLESSQVSGSTTPQIRYHLIKINSISSLLCQTTVIVMAGPLPPRFLPMSEDLSE